MQLVAYGAQDVYLTGSPQITFFKLVYRRHTNFAVESIEQVFNGTPGFGKKASVTLSRNGDLVTQCVLQITVPSLSSLQPALGGGGERTGWVRYANSFAHCFVESCEVEIGGQRIDKHYSGYFEAMDELTIPEPKRIGYEKMIGKHGVRDDDAPYDSIDETFQLDRHMGAAGEMTFYMPLRFWFNKNPGLALPLISLQYHEVKLQFNFLGFEKLINWKNGEGKMNNLDDKPTLTGFSTDASVALYVDYVYLDTDERRRFAQAPHEYLIEQLQYTGAETYTLKPDTITNEKVRLNFNHPVKELLILGQSADSLGDNKHFDFGENVWQLDNVGAPHVKGYDWVTHAKILLNGHDRFSERPGSYFRLVVPFQTHTRIPNRHIYCYSFSLTPEAHQPSGSCNFSRIDNASLHLTLAKSLPDVTTIVVNNPLLPFTEQQSLYTDLTLRDQALVYFDFYDPSCFITPGVANLPYYTDVFLDSITNLEIVDLSPNDIPFPFEGSGGSSGSVNMTGNAGVGFAFNYGGAIIPTVPITNSTNWTGSLSAIILTNGFTSQVSIPLAIGDETTANSNSIIGMAIKGGAFYAFRKVGTNIDSETPFSYQAPTYAFVHAVMTVQPGGVVTLYVNGTQVGSVLTLGDINIGGSNLATIYFNGKGINNFTMYDGSQSGSFSVYDGKVLSINEIKSLYYSVIDFIDVETYPTIHNITVATVEADNTIPKYIYTAPQSTTTSPTNTQLLIHVYAISYNILRVMSGMGGLAYSN